MKIKIDKEKMWRVLLLEKLYYLWLVLLIFLVPIIGRWLDFEINLFGRFTKVSLFILFVIVGINILCNMRYVDTLEYEITDDRLLKTYEIITKTKDSARLQVVNSVDINQSIIDKINNVFSINICYGFGEGGYYFSFDFLSEGQADELMDKIKPRGKSVEIK